MKRLTNSWIKHFSVKSYDWHEHDQNRVLGNIHDDGRVFATFENSEAKQSLLQAKLYSLGPFRALIGTSTGYTNYPDGAPYYSFGIMYKNRFHMILLAPHGFVYVGLDQEETNEKDNYLSRSLVDDG